MKYEKGFREAHPETVGETDGYFDLGNYANWLELEYEKLNEVKNNALLHNVSGSLPDLMECNQAALDYAENKKNPDFFLIKQVFKDGINWGLNIVTKNYR